MASQSDASGSQPMFPNTPLRNESEEKTKIENESQKTGSHEKNKKLKDNLGPQWTDDTMSDAPMSESSGDSESKEEGVQNRSQDPPPKSSSESDMTSLSYNPKSVSDASNSFSSLCEALDRLNATIEAFRKELKIIAKENFKKDLDDEAEASE